MNTEATPTPTPAGRGLRGLFEVRWLTQLNEQPWVRRLRARLNPPKSDRIAEISLISFGNKTLAVGLEWKSIIAAGPKAGRQIASKSDASHMIEYLGQCVGLGRMESSNNKVLPVALAVLVMRLLQTDRSSVLLHLPEQSKVWALAVNHRRPYGAEALLNYDEVGSWLDQNAAQFVHIHSDLSSDDLQAYYPPEHIYPLTLEQALKSQVFRADQLVSLRPLSPAQLMRQYPTLKWVSAALLLWVGAEYGLDEYRAILAERIEIQRRLLIEKESPSLLWDRQIKGLLERLPAPDADSMAEMLRTLHELPVWMHGWRLNKLSCTEQSSSDKSSPYLARVAVATQAQSWMCKADYAVDPQNPAPATFEQLNAELPERYQVRWLPLKNFELSWAHPRKVQSLTAQDLESSREITLTLGSLLQQLSSTYRVTADLKWAALPMPTVRRSDGSDAPKPKDTRLPVVSPVSVSGALSQLSELLQTLPADWRQLEMSFSPANTAPDKKTPWLGTPMPQAEFTLKGALYASE